MGKVTRKRYSADFKAKVALDALRGEQTLAPLAAKHGVHAVMIANWKRQAIEGLAAAFAGKAEAVCGQSTALARDGRQNVCLNQVKGARKRSALLGGYPLPLGNGRVSNAAHLVRPLGSAPPGKDVRKEWVRHDTIDITSKNEIASEILTG